MSKRVSVVCLTLVVVGVIVTELFTGVQDERGGNYTQEFQVPGEICADEGATCWQNIEDIEVSFEDGEPVSAKNPRNGRSVNLTDIKEYIRN